MLASLRSKLIGSPTQNNAPQHDPNNPPYHKATYWDSRYQTDPEPLDWYQNYNALRTHFHELVNPTDKILNVGCGNSRLSFEMRIDGYRDITNIDISTVLIERYVVGREAEHTWDRRKPHSYGGTNLME